MRKQYLVLLLVGLVAAGLMFTGCPEVETTWTFENHSKFNIQVESKDLDPDFFILKAYPGTDDQLLLPGVGENPPVDTKKATSTKSKPKIGWICEGQSVTVSENNVKMTQSGSVIRFEKISGEEGGLAKIELAE